MKNLIWVSLAIVSIVISAFLNFNEATVANFIKWSLAHSLFFFTLAFLLVKLVRNVKEKQSKKVALHILLLFILSILAVGYHNVISYYDDCVKETYPSFRTNIFTGQCEYGYTPTVCLATEPWYFTKGCNISDGEKIKKFESYCEAILASENVGREAAYNCRLDLSDKKLIEFLNSGQIIYIE